MIEGIAGFNPPDGISEVIDALFDIGGIGEKARDDLLVGAVIAGQFLEALCRLVKRSCNSARVLLEPRA